MTTVTVCGNLARDPELRHTNSGKPLCEFTLATNKAWKDKTGARQEKVSFIPCTLFGDSAKLFSETHKKGMKALVYGELEMDQWTDKETGKERTKLKVTVHQFEFLTPKQSPVQATPNQGQTAEAKPDDDVPF